MGSRLLRRWLNRPIRQQDTLQLRHAFIAQLQSAYLTEDLHSALKQVGDVERILSRITLGSARPRDLARLRDALTALPNIRAFLSQLDTPLSSQLLQKDRKSV